MPPPLPAAPPAVRLAAAQPSWHESTVEDLPDFLDGAARRRRVIWTVLAVAVLALLGAFAATIASHFRPM